MKIIAKEQLTQDQSISIRPGKTLTVLSGSSPDLLTSFTLHELSQSDALILAIMNGDLVINDGVNDLGKVRAVDLIRGYKPEEIVHTYQNKVTQDPDVQLRPIGFQFTATQGTTTDYTWKFPETLCLKGGIIHVANNTIKDKLDLKITDEDNVLGYGVGATIVDYVKNWNIPVSGTDSIVDESISDEISSVLYLKASYHAQSGTDREVCFNLLAYKPT